jgi:RNA-binding protein YlmH
MNEDELLFQKRIKDLAGRSYKNSIYTFTGFLGLNEQSIFFRTLSEIPGTSYELYGGTEFSERKMLRFGSFDDFGYEEPFPICCIEIKPLMAKFADKLSHRDVLGTLMNLGIERAMVGDIIVKPEIIYVLCHEKMAEYICKNVSKIKHTSVSLQVTDVVPKALAPELSEVTLHCSSLRVDGIISKAFKLSRSESEQLFQKALVFINGRVLTKSGIPLKNGDVVSVRGFGKFIYEGEARETKKGNLCVKIKKYI